MSGTLVRDVRRIAVFRPSAVGDFMFCLPALHALHQTYREAEIVYIGSQWHQDFLAGRPGPVDRVLVLPEAPGINAAPDAQTDTGALAQFIDRMRGEQFDLALQMYGGGRYANPLVNSFGARVSVGMRSADAAPLDRCIPYCGLVNQRLRLLEVAALAGARAWPMGRQLEVTKRDCALAARLLGDCGSKPLVMLQPGASDARRCWPVRRFAAVGDALAELGAQVVVNGAADEAALVSELVHAMRHEAVDLAGKASLHALCGLLERTALLVSNDTGPLHLALALGRPCVGIYWFTNLIESAPLCQGAHRAAVSLRTGCPVCAADNLTSRCRHDVSFVDDVPLDEVAALAVAALRGEAGPY